MGKCCRCTKNTSLLNVQDHSEYFKEQLKNRDIRYKKLDFRIDIDWETLLVLTESQAETTKMILKRPLLRDSQITIKKELDLTSTS